MNALQTVGYQNVQFDRRFYIAICNRRNQEKNTRRFAKRQLTWFRRDENTKWFDYLTHDSVIVGLKFTIPNLCQWLSSVFLARLGNQFHIMHANGYLKHDVQYSATDCRAHSVEWRYQFTDMQGVQSAWVLSRMRVEIIITKWRDVVTVKTWIPLEKSPICTPLVCQW
jgi:hypothetical protein